MKRPKPSRNLSIRHQQVERDQHDEGVAAFVSKAELNRPALAAASALYNAIGFSDAELR